MKKLFTILSLLIDLSVMGQGYQPPKHVVLNDAIFQAQPAPLNGRTMYYDTLLFKYRDFRDTTEVRVNRATNPSRFGHEFISVHQGGTLNSDGSFTGGIVTFWCYRNGLADSNLAKIYVDSVSVPRAVVYVKRLTDSTFYASRSDSTRDTVLIRGTSGGGISSLVLNAPFPIFATPVNFSNTGGAWSGTLSLNTQNPNFVLAGPTLGGPGAVAFRSLVTSDLPTGIPNGNLANSSITFTTGTSGTSPNWGSATVALGGTQTLNMPIVNTINTGVTTPSLFNYWNGKVDSLTQSNDSVYKWANGTRGFQFIVAGGSGGITTLNTLTATTQTFATGTAGTDFSIVSAGSTHTFNFPTASASNRGLLSTSDWSSFNARLTGGSGLSPLFTAAITGGTTLTFTQSTTSGYTFYGNGNPTTGTSSFTKIPYQAFGNSSPNILFGTDGSGVSTTIVAGTNITISGGTISATGAVSIPPNIGSGFRIYSPQVPGFKTLFAGTNVTIDSTTNANGLTINSTGGGGASPANPTGTIGLTAVNGSLSTFMRSDGAPPLSQAISPTWTGSHIFNNPILTGTSNLAIGGWLYNNKVYTDASRALVTKDTANLIMPFYNANPLNYSQSVNFRQAAALLYNTLQSATIDTTTQGMLVFSDNFSRGSIGAAYTVASPGMTVSISSAGLELSAVTAPANYLNFITRTDSLGWTCADKGRIHFKYYNKVLNSTSYGPMVAFHSQNAEGFPHTVLAAVQQYTGAPNIGKAVLVGGDTQGYAAFASSGMGTISVGDTIDVSITRNGLVYTIVCVDLNTAGTSTVIVPANQDGTPFPANNTSTIGINFLGGDIVVTQLDYTLLVPYRPDYLVFGNSIVWGQGSGTTPSQAARFPNMAFAQANNIVVLGGGADYTAQFVQLLPEMRRINPRFVIAGPLAGNDILFAISSGTWQANLQTIRDGLSNNNIPVIWFTDPPRSDVSTLPIRTYIAGNSDFSTDQQIFSSYDSLVNASATTMQTSYSGGSDGVHPNPNGHRKLGDLLSSALPIQNGLTRIKLPIQVSGGAGYVLPTASTTVLGGVKIDGTTITISGGVISATGGGGGTPGGASTSLQFNDGGTFNGFGLYTKATSLLSIGASAITPYADLSIDHNYSGLTELAVENTNAAGIPFLQIGGDGAGGLLFGRRNVSSGNLGIWLAGMDALATSDASDLLIENTTAHDIFFGTNGSERIRFKNSGNLLIGTSTDNSGFLQTAANTTTNASLFINGYSADVSSPTNGMLWYNSTTHALNFRDNGVTTNLLAGGGGSQNLTYTQNATNNNLAISGGNNVNFLTATTSLAGLLDTARAKFIDSLRAGTKTFNLFVANGLTAAAGDSIYWGGTLNQPTTLALGGFSLKFIGLPPAVASTATTALVRNATDSSLAQMALRSGTFTPTATVTSGTATLSGSTANYIVVGNMVFVSGSFAISSGVASVTTVTVTVPISPTSLNSNNGTGTIAASSTSVTGAVSGQSSGSTITLIFTISVVTGSSVSYSYSYPLN